MQRTVVNHKVDNGQPRKAGDRSRKRRFVFLLTLVIIVGLTVMLHLTYGRHPERLIELRNYAYGGAFLISLIGNATILFPGAVLVILSNLGILLYGSIGLSGPIIVGLVGGLGAAIGESTGFIAGYSGRELVTGRKIYGQIEGWVRRWGSLAIFLFSLVPLVFDLVGIVAGVLRFPFWKFVIFCGLGRTILYVVCITLAALGWRALLPYFG